MNSIGETKRLAKRTRRSDRLPEVIRRAANEACIYIADTPVLNEGRLKLLGTEEQSLSIDYACGNLGACAIEKRNGPV